MQGRYSAFQEDDGDGKVPVSALTRRDGHWPGGNHPNSAHGRSHLYPTLRTLPWVWNPLRGCPLSVPTNGPRRSLWRAQRRAPTRCAQVFLPDSHLSEEGVCRTSSRVGPTLGQSKQSPPGGTQSHWTGSLCRGE